MTYLLSIDSIILCNECECHEFCCLEVRLCGYHHEDSVATGEGGVFKTEGCALRFGFHVLSRSEKEEVRNYNLSALPLEEGVSQIIVNAWDVPEYLEGVRLYLTWGGSFLL